MGIPESKRRSPAEAAALVERRDTLGLPLGPGQPKAFMTALGERDDFEDLLVSSALLLGLYPLFTKPGVRLRSGFFGPVERGLRAAGHDVQFVPADFRRFTRLLETLRPRVMATIAASPDAQGWMSLSLHSGATTHELRAAGNDPDRLLVVEVNSALPRTLGLPPEAPHAIHLDEADVIIEAVTPLPIVPEAPGGEVEERIAKHVAPFVHEGATLQTGIGGIPGQVVAMLAEGSIGDFGVHSEMFTDGLMALHRAGKVSNARKGMHDGISVCTFAGGSEALYTWLDGNEEVRFLPVEAVNAPETIAANRDMVCINGALAIDLAGQVAADTIGEVQYSGVGGHEDFTGGPGLENSDRSFICLPSTAKVHGRVVSRITPSFEPGTVVTTPRHQLDVVVTEHGAAELAGLTVAERAAALIGIADPAFREGLRKAAPER
ncbi:MAG: acetyl-CoA hydrolase/transferase family protein [bacterium]|nr:acetyl-CoA hydrolase/transferase family protein [bacterium]